VASSPQQRVGRTSSLHLEQMRIDLAMRPKSASTIRRSSCGTCSSRARKRRCRSARVTGACADVIRGARGQTLHRSHEIHEPDIHRHGALGN